jgi:hypothetical protein
MQVEYVEIDSVIPNESNPRKITEKKLSDLMRSMKNFPIMQKLRPIIVDENMVAIGGNQRLKAAKKLGWTHVHIMKESELTEDQKKEFVVKDNVSFGYFDDEVMMQDYTFDQLVDFGVDMTDIGKGAKEKEIDENKEVIPQMELRFNEHYDYIVFLFDNDHDWLYISNKLGLKKVDSSYSPKNKKIGLGRVIQGNKILELLKELEAKNEIIRKYEKGNTKSK